MQSFNKILIANRGEIAIRIMRAANEMGKKTPAPYTPRHGSWLNIAECELSVLARQCLDRRIPDRATLNAQIRAWTKTRNTATAKVNWQFSTDDARVKLEHLYPQIR